MDEWMRQPVSQLKRLVKSRAGRIAELQMEIKILEGIIDRKVQEGELGGSSGKSRGGAPSPGEAPAKAGAGPESPPAGQEPGTGPSGASQEEGRGPELSKISAKSSEHAFEELD